MTKTYLALLALFLISSCATYEVKYAGLNTSPAPIDKEHPTHTFYLVGDAGKSPMGAMNPVLKNIQTELSKAPENSTAIFLGDNIYPSGFPHGKTGKAYTMAKNHLDAQLESIRDFKGQTLFMPGNHDWYSEGPKGLKRQEKYIEGHLKGQDAFLPKNGCPLKKVEINEDIVLIVIDTQWYLVDWDKYPTINDNCEIKDRGRFLEELEGLIKKNRDKTTILAMHHPMFTYGPHGGQFSLKQHLFPTEGKFPLPVIGTLANFLRRTTGASNTDQSNKMYNELKKRIVTLAQYSDKVIFVSGHEHTLQYIVKERIPQIVSGSGANKGAARPLDGSRFSTGKMGYAVLKVYPDGSSTVEFFGVDGNSKTSLFKTEVLSSKRAPLEFKGPKTFPAEMTASIYDDDEVDRTGFFKKVWGERYRKYYAAKIKAPTVDLDTLYGGLAPIRKGGGNQSRSLRLMHKDGRQFVMRALRKSAELYLQGLAFQEKYVVGDFEGTLTENLLLDFYTGSHPYAPFTIGELSDAVGIYHTNPKLFYIPKQAALKEFNTDFGDELYMVEEHLSDGHDLKSFGHTKKIVSTQDLMKKLRKDEEYQLDTKAYIRARLFDMLIGDWDRHIDQWRWAQFKQGDGTKLFRPIPRDRDQAFSIMGDGALMAFASRAVPALRLFEGFKEEIRSVKGFNSSPMTFALDMALLSGTTIKDWVHQAKHIQDNLDGTAIDGAFGQFPEAVRDSTVDKIKEILLKRKKSLVQTAKTYYQVLNTHSVVTGTDKDDHFIVAPVGNGNLSVKGYRIKNGRKSDVFFDKFYSPQYNKEIWIYGLDDGDIFEVNGDTGPIKIRLVGGQNNDSYKIDEMAKNVHIYDFKKKKNTYDEAYGGKLHKLNDYDTNTYQFLKVKASKNQFLPTIGLNPDDGMRIGFTNTYTFNGFRQNPFTQQHTVNGAFYFATSGFDIGYLGEFAHIFEKVNLELEARFTSPNFAVNFFGFGNDTRNDDGIEELELDFNRVKIRQLYFSPSLVWRGFLGSKAKLGISYGNFGVEKTEGRFIEGFYSDRERDTQQEFFGIDASYEYANYDNRTFPTMGMSFSLEGGYTTNLTDPDRAFGHFIPSISFDYKLVPNGQLVLATKFKGHFNIGNGYEFYQAASIGGDNGIRGFRFQRFTGKTAYFQNTDLRLSFQERKTRLLPITPGIYGGFDYGRVWQPNETSDTWHNSYGGGIFINGADALSFNAGLFNSSDGARFAFGLGFGF